VAELALTFEAPPGAGGRPPLAPAWECAYRAEIAGEVEAAAARGAEGAAVGAEELLAAEHALSTLAVHDPEARLLHQLLDLLDERWTTDRNRWRDVVYALANTSASYRPLAEWFSAKYEKWAAGTTKRREAFGPLWDEAVARRGRVAAPLTARSLRRWARECAPARYEEIVAASYYEVLATYVYEYGGALEHYMVARVLHAMLGTKFVYDVDAGAKPGSAGSHAWYEFVVPGQPARPGEVWKWRREDDPAELHKYLSDNLAEVFATVAADVDQRGAEAEDEGRAKYYRGLSKALVGMRRRLSNRGFKRATVEEARLLFRRRGFCEDLDRERGILGVGNGVLRLGATAVLVDHFHEHLVHRYTPVPWRRFDPTDPWVRLMLDALADIIPERDVLVWFLMWASTSLGGGPKAGILLLWYGGGANGKTWVMRMVAKALGRQYSALLDIGLLTFAGKSDPSAPNPALMQLKGKRWGYIEETKQAELLNTQNLKRIVNPGEISGNGKFRDQENFDVEANVAVGHNFDFVITTCDHGTWRRLRYYTSKVTFVRNPDPGNPYEKRMDRRYVDQYVDDPACQEAFLAILVHFNERLAREYGGDINRVPCPTLERETQAFRNGQDTVNRFLTENVVVSPGAGFEYPLPVLAGRYHEWYDRNIDRRRHVASETIQALTNSALGRYFRVAPGAVKVVAGCRVLTAETRELAPGEYFLGAPAPGEGEEKEAPAEEEGGGGAGAMAPAGGGAKTEWWEAEEPPAPRPEEAAEAAEDAEFLAPLASDAGFVEPGVAARAAARAAREREAAAEEAAEQAERDEYARALVAGEAHAEIPPDPADVFAVLMSPDA
jgi:phage/plasmid-associated DNA primase